VAKIAADHWLRNFIQEHLELEWSPEQICAFLRIHHPDHVVSVETIYKACTSRTAVRSAVTRRMAVSTRTGTRMTGPTTSTTRHPACPVKFEEPPRLVAVVQDQNSWRTISGVVERKMGPRDGPLPKS
jgi:IS30 family transposase